MQHYISLYVLASKFQMPRLGDQVVDLIREYYRNNNMTAPPFRLVFIYQHTVGDNALRRFLVASAAYRVLKKGDVSNIMQDIISTGGQLAVDLVKRMVKMHSTGIIDPREGSNCVWRDHDPNKICLLQNTHDGSIAEVSVESSGNEA
jgi:hypothetical protein